MSTRATNTLSNRIRIALLALVILLLVTSTPSPKASAVSGCTWSWKVVYFTDATMTALSGMTIYMCSGEIREGGTVTEYAVTYECECGPGPHPVP